MRERAAADAMGVWLTRMVCAGERNVLGGADPRGAFCLSMGVLGLRRITAPLKLLRIPAFSPNGPKFGRGSMGS